jgi:rare lipoprotein A
MTTMKIKNTNPLIVSLVITILTVLSLTGCSKSSVAPVPFPEVAPKSFPEVSPKPYRVGKEWYQPIANAREFKQQGVASWYGKDFHGKKTSSGEIYDMYDMTAAHKILPLGTFVRVKNLKNNRVIDVRINDRGPFVAGRVIDLSYTAASKLEIIGPGTATVEIVALGTPDSSKKDSKDIAYTPVDYFSGVFSVQVGAFQDQNNADRLKNEIAQIHRDTYISPFSSGDKTFYRVRVGRYNTVDKVMNTEKVLIEKGYTDAFAVAE